MAKASEYRASLAKETATEEQIAAYRDIVAKSNEKLNQAREYIKEAHDLLNEIMTKLREAYKNKIPLEDKADVGAAGDSSEDSTSAASDSERPRRSRFACDDSDGGRDIFAAGSVNGFSGYMKGEFVDYCSDDEDGIGSADEGKYVHEYFCQDGLVVGNTYKCDNGCSKGACVE
jgi:seryl-tRNA synthetase